MIQIKIPYRFIILIPLFLALPLNSAIANQKNFGHINNKSGLSHNQVLCFAEDNNGFMWIGTRSGLNRFDGYGLKVFKHDQYDPNTVADNMILNIVKDQLGRLWINTSAGMSIFNPNTEDFSRDFNLSFEDGNYNLSNLDMVLPAGDSILVFRIPGIGLIEYNIYTNQNWLLRPMSGDPTAISSANISYMVISGDTLYVIHRNGMIDLVQVGTRHVVKCIDAMQKVIEKDYDFELFVDDLKNLWVYINGEALGLYQIDNLSRLRHFFTGSAPALNSNLVTGIIQDSDHNYWIGTDHGGLNILDHDLKKIEYVVNEISNENSLSQDVITDIYIGEKGIIWIGTFKKGVNFYHKNLFRFALYTHQPNDPNSLPYNDVNCFAEDKSGNLWIGTNGQGLIYFDRKKNVFSTFTGDSRSSGGLLSNVIVSLYVDKKNHLWIGTYHGGLSVYDGFKFTTYLNDPYNPKSIGNNKVWDIFEDSHGNMWIGMLGGLDLFNQDHQIFHHYNGSGINSLNSNFVMDITEDPEGNIWFGTDSGVFIFQYNSSRFIHYLHAGDDKTSLSNNFVYNVFRDSRGNMWAGTRNGLNLFVKETHSFIRFNTDNGLPDPSIMSILESDMNNLWLATSNGLCKLVVDFDAKGQYSGHHTINFNESDGLQDREFNEGSVFKTSRRELIFGGANGFNLFMPEFEDTRYDQLLTHIIGFEIFGEEIRTLPREPDKKNKETAIFDSSTIKLTYKENIFSLKFVAINYLGAQKISYRYKLEGFNDKWINTTWEDRKATYTNLKPGAYIFKVQASANMSEWSNSECLLNIIIQPPWYLTWLAYLVYGLVLAAIILISRRMIISSAKNRLVKEQAIKESERQHELNALKTRFFTNVSHEFRTPLTLILTPLERLLKNNYDKDTKKHLDLISQNARRLLNLVNQLLDFRQAEANKLKANFIYGNIIGFIDQTINSFADLKESQNIQLEFLPDEKELYMQFDKDKVEKILLNLLSNAFKFTPEKGYIKVFTELIKNNESEHLIIIVEDTGIGIKKEQQEKIFERFYQTDLPDGFIQKGSGIGLSLTKEFVELHNGSISVESEPGRGSRFIVDLPVNRNLFRKAEDGSDIEPVDIISHEPETFNDLKPHRINKTVLLVEDNREFRIYLRDSLQEKYNILEAENGKAALELIASKQPDLIVSDVMMPEMNGLELCAEIKTNSAFSHIPVILLTAKSSEEDKIDGLKQGADEYITKPFSYEILDSRMEYLLSLREKFISHYQKSFKIEAHSKSITALDTKLLEKALSLIRENLSNTEFTVEKLSHELGMSRVYLYKKITALTGKTPNELIRLVRLKKAAELLIESQMTISEITYEVGFGDPRYFSKQFKAEFRILPSKYRENQGIDSVQ
jgi:signal transduction histidine kinase/ligand-binding sensor domain-containing protein/DNA-binding response OmpR family regulator